MKILINCQRSSELISQRLDEELGLRQKIQLRMHLAICKACPNTVKNFNLMRNQLKKWKNYTENSE